MTDTSAASDSMLSDREHGTNHTVTLPRSVQKFIDDAIEVLLIQLATPGRSLRSITIKTTFWPHGTTEASETYPKPKVVTT